MYPINHHTSIYPSPSGSGAVASTSVQAEQPPVADEPACFSRTIDSTVTEPPEVDLEKMKHWPNRISTVIAVGLSEIASKYPADGEKLINSLNKTFVVLDEAVKNLASDSDPRSPAIMNLLGQSTSEGISKSKSELLDTFKKVRDELTNLKDNSSSRLFLARGRHVNETLAAVKVDDPEKKMIITDKLMRSSSINQIQTLIHETVHLTRHSDDYRYSPLKYDIELTGGRVNRENTEKSLNDQQDVLAAMYQTPEEQFTNKNLADLQKGGGPKRSYSSMARDAGERPRSGTKICDLAKNSESFRRMIGLNNPDTIAALASAYGREALLHHEGAVEKPTLRPINPDIETNDFERKSAERAARRALREAEHQAALLELQHLTDRAAQQLADPDKMDIQTKLWLDTFLNEEPHSDYSDKNLLHPEFDQLFLPCDPDNDPPDDELEEMTATAGAARFSDAKLLDPRFSQSYVPDQDDMDVYNAMDVQHCRDDFRQTPTVSGALDLIERLQHVTSDVQRNAVTDPELLRPLAKLALLSDTSRGRGYGAEVAEPIRYAATLTRDLLRQDQLSPERTAQLWFGQADCPAQILLPVRLIHAASQASRGVYVDLMADILSHPNLSQAQLHAITTAVKTHLPALSKEPLVGTRDAHQRLLREMADAGLSITKRRGMFSGGLGITVHATAPTHRPPAPADYLNRVDVDALRTGLGRRLDHLQALEAGDYAGTSGVVVSDRWRTLQHDKEIRRLNANYQRENIGQRLEGQNQWLADQSKFQKKVYTQESRRKLAEAEQQASLRRRQDAAVWEAEHAQRTHAIMDRVAEKRQAAKQQQAIETRANVESAIHGYRSVSDAPVRGLPSTPALLAVGGPDPLAGSLTLPTSTFAPMYEIGDKSIMIQALNRQGQPIRVEVPSSPTQGSGIVVNYRQGSSPSPLLSTGSGTSAPTRYHAPVVDALYHHERSGLPVLTLKNARGDTFSAASFQGFTLHTEQGLHTTTYNRVEPGTSTQQRMLQRTPAAPAMPPPPRQDRASASGTWGRDAAQAYREQVAVERKNYFAQQAQKTQAAVEQRLHEKSRFSQQARETQAAVERRLHEKSHFAQQARETRAWQEQRSYQQQQHVQRAEQAFRASQLQKDTVQRPRITLAQELMATKQTPTVPTSEAGETADNAKLPKKEAVRQQRITQVRGLMAIEQTPTVPTPNAGEMANNTKLHN